MLLISAEMTAHLISLKSKNKNLRSLQVYANRKINKNALSVPTVRFFDAKRKGKY